MRQSRYPILTSPSLLFPREVVGLALPAVGGGNAWPVANLAIYCPFTLPVDAVVNGVKFNCTSGNSAGRNFDAGFFDAATNAKLSSSGATLVAAGVNTWAANQPITGGVPYFFGLSVTSTAVLIWRRAQTALQNRELGFAQEASANPLPTTATPAQMAQAYVPTVVFTFANLP